MTTAVDGRRRLFLIFCCIALVSAFVIRSGTHVAARGTQEPASRAGSGREPPTAGASPARRLSAAGWRSWIDVCAGLDGNGRSCADCHMPTDHFQLSPASAETRFRLLSLLRDDSIQMPTIRCSGRSTPMTSAPTAENASDFSNLRQNGLIRIAFPLPPKIRLIDPVTNLVSNETSVDVWRMVPTVNDVKLTGDDGENAWPRGPNSTGGYQLDARFATLQEQALAALRGARRDSEPAAQTGCSTIWRRFSGFCSRTTAFARFRTPSREGTVPLPDPDPPLNELEQQGKAVFERACSVCHGGPATVDHAVSDRSLPRHPDPVSAATPDVHSSLSSRARRGWLGMPGRTRLSCRSRPYPGGVVQPAEGSADELRSGPRPYNGICRRSGAVR